MNAIEEAARQAATFYEEKVNAVLSEAVSKALGTSEWSLSDLEGRVYERVENAAHKPARLFFLDGQHILTVHSPEVVEDYLYPDGGISKIVLRTFG